MAFVVATIGALSAVAAVPATGLVPGPWAAALPASGRQARGAPAGARAQSSSAADPATLALGEEVYRSQCQPCHGREGKGDGPAARFVDPKPRDLTSGKWQHVREPSVEEIVRVVTNGVPDTGMEPFAELLTDEEIRAVAAYVLEHFAPPPKPGAAPR